MAKHGEDTEEATRLTGGMRTIELTATHSTRTSSRGDKLDKDCEDVTGRYTLQEESVNGRGVWKKERACEEKSDIFLHAGASLGFYISRGAGFTVP